MILHFADTSRGRAYCGGHKPAAELIRDWNRVTCPNCLAAARADRLVLPRHLRAAA